MASCIPKSVISGATCTENPAGLGNYLFAVPLENIASITANAEKNQYDIKPKAKAGASASDTPALQGYRIDYKSQTGQYTSDDNGTGKGWSATATGRVELSEDDMVFTSRVLHNSDKFLYFFFTGQTNADGLKEFIVVGNENGEAEWSTKADTGTKRTDDHGQTFTVKCDYQLYSKTKWYGNIDQADATAASTTPSSSESHG